MIDESSISSKKSRYSTCSERYDLPDLYVFLGLLITMSFAFLFSKVNPLFVPENDSLSSFPIPAHETVPAIVLLIILVVVPLVFIILFYFLSKKFPDHFKGFHIMAVVWNLLIAQMAVQLVTEIIKSYVGRARPDMYAHCGQNAQYETCKATGMTLSDSFKSFPSGHASGSISAMYFIAVFTTKVIVDDSILKAIFALLYILLGLYVGASRIRDFRHHADDVVAGLFVGFLVTSFIWKNAKKRIFPEVQIESTLKKNLIEA